MRSRVFKQQLKHALKFIERFAAVMLVFILKTKKGYR